MSTISSDSVTTLKAKIDAATADPTGIPGVVYCAVNRKGDLVFEHASGKVGVGRERDIDLETVFWTASCTKMITGIACMQLVERGMLALDDADLVERLCPELKEVKVLEEGGRLVEKKRRITLRMLLSHTAGFGYSFFNKKLNDYYGAIGLDEVTGLSEEYLTQPLVNQPGERWEYGINIDWADMSLNDYFQKHIFMPMDLEHVTMFPSTQMKKDLAYLSVRDPEGKLSLRPEGQLNRRPLMVRSSEDIESTFNAGGSGCFARPVEYCQLIAMLLNDGTHAKTGAQILQSETVKEMFTNQIKEMPDFGRQGIDSTKPLLSNPISDLYPQPPEQAQGWGLTFFLHVHPGPTGRSAGTGWWAGLPNLFWWADRKNGLGGMIASQIVPFGDAKVMGLWGEVETGLYQGLSVEGSMEALRVN